MIRLQTWKRAGFWIQIDCFEDFSIIYPQPQMIFKASQIKVIESLISILIWQRNLHVNNSFLPILCSLTIFFIFAQMCG